MSVILAWLGARFAGLWAKAAIVGGVLVSILLLALKFISIGRAEQREAEDKQRLDAIAAKKECDNEVDHLGAADVDHNLAQWMRDKTK